MTAKIGLLILAALLLVGMISRSLSPRPAKRKGDAIEAARKCPTCGAYALADARCARADCPQA